MPNKKTVSLLSIDWDYFIDASYEQRTVLMPDSGNENLPYGIQTAIWASHYSNFSPKDVVEKLGKLKDITTNERDVQLMSSFIAKQVANKNIKDTLIAESHQLAYDFFEEASKDYDSVELCHIDYHHDCFTNNDGSDRNVVDCGNWLKAFMRSHKGNYEWIARKDSDFYDANDETKPIENISFDLKRVLNKNWDYIFVCRSGMWSPPHLDKDFIETFYLMQYTGRYQPIVYEDRFADENFQNFVNVNNEFMEKSFATKQTKQTNKSIDDEQER